MISLLLYRLVKHLYIQCYTIHYSKVHKILHIDGYIAFRDTHTTYNIH